MREGPILRVELHDPANGNVVTEAMLTDLLQVLAAPDPDVRVLVLTAAGDDFCLGGDRAEFSDWLDEDPTGRGIRLASDKARRVCEAISTSHAVTIAAVHGKVIGAGLGLALACDLRVGADDAGFRLPELALGLPTAGRCSPAPDQRSRRGARPRTRPDRPGFRRSRGVRAVDPATRGAPGHPRRGGLRLGQAHRPPPRGCPARHQVGTQLHAAPTRLGDPSLLDAELMACVAAATRRARGTGGIGPIRRSGGCLR